MVDTIVVDSSLAIKWVINQPYSAEAALVLAQWGAEGIALIAPRLFLIESANVLYQYVRVKTPGIASISLADAQGQLDILEGLVTIMNEDLQLLQRAQVFAYQVGRPATYDDVYATLAEREGCEFWTADERYWNAVKSRRPWVRCIADPSLPLRAASSP